MTWAEEGIKRTLPPPGLGLPLNQGHTTCECAVRAPSSAQPVLDLLLCCRHLEILNNCLAWALTFSRGSEPTNHVTSPAPLTVQCLVSGPCDNTEHYGLPTPNSLDEIWRQLRWIISLAIEKFTEMKYISFWF